MEHNPESETSPASFVVHGFSDPEMKDTEDQTKALNDDRCGMDCNESSSAQWEQEKSERLARLQQYRQGVWELNFDFHAFQRWRHVGLAQRLTCDTEIACFLLLHFEKTYKDSKQVSAGRCSRCQSVLSCIRCESMQHTTHLSTTAQTGKNTVKPEALGEGDTLQNVPVSLADQGKKPRAARKKEELTCSVCSITFTRAASLKVHMRKHTGEKPYVCNTCGATFSHSYSLSIHNRSHTGHKPFVCEQCGAAFTVSSTLKQHMVKHSGEKPYKCDLCPSAFTQCSKLTIHMRKHTGARPYQCEHCGASFTHCARLKIHLRTHSGFRPYKCQECGKCFTQSAHLTVHNRIHTGDKPFQCKQCNAAFLDSTHLRRHERKHSAEKAHVCRDCGASYSTAFGLRRHEWSHTEHEKPYKCSGCLVSFTFNSCLKRHQAKGHCQVQQSETS